jgi:hypothetical protein
MFSKRNDRRPDWRSIALFAASLIFLGSMIVLVLRS